MDVPLWDTLSSLNVTYCLNPSFSGCPALGRFIYGSIINKSLNPSFSGCPALGEELGHFKTEGSVLIPLLVDVPLWDNQLENQRWQCPVLIPLLVDVPLWA